MNIQQIIELDADEVVAAVKHATGDQSITWKILDGTFTLTGEDGTHYPVSTVLSEYLGAMLVCDFIANGPAVPILTFSTVMSRGVGVAKDMLRPASCYTNPKMHFSPIVYEKVLEKPIEGELVGPGRFVRLEGKSSDYKICISFFASGYIDVRVFNADVNAPEVYIRYNDTTPICAYALINSKRETTSSIPDRLAFELRLYANLDAIDDIIKQINEGERFTH